MTDTTPISELYCPECGYDLRALTSNRCPECGLVIDRNTIRQSLIPWVNCASIGWFKAFWRTVWMSIRRPGTIAREAAKPVSYRDAQLFRWLVVCFAAVPMTGWLIACQIILAKEITRIPDDIAAPNPFGGISQIPVWLDPILCWVRALSMWYLTPIAIGLMLAGWTGVASYFFHPRSLSTIRQNRAIATSYYACGPLALAILPALLWGIAIGAAYLLDSWPKGYSKSELVMLLILGASLVLYLTLFGVPISWWLSTLRMLQSTTHWSLWRLSTAAVAIPLTWLIVAFLSLGLFPAVCGFIALIIESYQS